ncbi:MAG: hypothetical protein WEF28_13030 [Acidimicrobiia bacterium]
MSDLLTAAAEALGTPTELVSRSAAARAEANGTTTEAILEAWAGGAPAAAPKPAETKPKPEIATEGSAAEPAAESDAEPAPAPELPVAAHEPAVAAFSVPEALEQPLEPVAIQHRLRTTGRIGSWTGAVLGLFAFVFAAASWSQTTSVTGEETFSPIFITDSNSLLIGVALVSVVFGAIVAAFARAAAGWVNPAMQLKSPKSRTAWVGGAFGFVLGVGAGALLAAGVGTPIEGSEGLIELPVLSTLIIMVLGGALLGAITTAVTQSFAVPAAVDESDVVEVETVRARMGNAVGIPLGAIALLALLVLPFARTLLESNHLTSGGASVVAIITALGILTFASLAGSRPNMKIGKGEFLVALAGIGIVVIILFAVLTNLGGESEAEEPAGEEAAAELVLN